MKKRKFKRRVGHRFLDILSKEDMKKMESLKSALQPEKVDIGSSGSDLRGYVPITKIDEEKRLVYGIATNDVLDNQDEIVEWEATKAAIPEFMKWRNLREMHRADSAAGTVEELEVDEAKRQIPIVAKVVDDGAWKKVKEKVYKGFSIGGKALNRVKEFDEGVGKVISKVKAYLWNEISLVDRPANPTCVFTLVKRDIGSRDPLAADIRIMKSKAITLESFILSDEDIAKLPNNKFGLVRRIKKRGKPVVERWFAMPSKAHAKAVMKLLPGAPLSGKEKFRVHDKALKLLGRSHDELECIFCNLRKNLKGGEIKKMADSRIKQAMQLLAEASNESGQEDYEAAMDAPEGVESEGLRDARRKEDRDRSMGVYEGSGYEDVEIPEGFDEEYYPEDYYIPEYDEDDAPEGYEEDFEGGVPTEFGEGSARLGYEEGQEKEDERTHIIDTEGEHDTKERPLDSEDREIPYDDEEYEGGDTCPYCGVTLKMLASGNLRKSSAQCPGCGKVWSMGVNELRTIDSNYPGGAVQKRSGGRISKAIAERDAIIADLVDYAEELEAKLPQRRIRKRKGAVRMPSPREEDEDLEKSSIQGDMQKAVELRQMSKDSGEALKPVDEAFCQRAVENSLRAKASK